MRRIRHSSPLRTCTLLLLVALSRAADGQDAARFERVLVPISVNRVPGAYGSLWSTELWYRNNSDRPVAVIPLAISDAVPTIGRTERLRVFYFPAHAPGQILFVSRDGADEVQFDLRLFNLADPQASWGTKLPVVRERAFRRGMDLLNVPTAADYRSALRVYGLPDTMADGDVVRVRIYTHAERLLAETDLVVTGWPRYAAILSLADAFPAIRATDRVRVNVSAPGSEAKIWAFVSVTSNTTQHVAIVTPE